MTACQGRRANFNLTEAIRRRTVPWARLKADRKMIELRPSSGLIEWKLWLPVAKT